MEKRSKLHDIAKYQFQIYLDDVIKSTRSTSGTPTLKIHIFETVFH